MHQQNILTLACKRVLVMKYLHADMKKNLLRVMSFLYLDLARVAVCLLVSHLRLHRVTAAQGDRGKKEEYSAHRLLCECIVRRKFS